MAGPPNRPDRLKYNEELYPKQARKLCLLGATNVELADFFEVNEETIYVWLKKYPEFNDAVKSAKLIADAEVAESLYKRATGFTVKEHKLFLDTGKRDENGNATILTEEIDRHFPPDTKAATRWLNNRRPQDWREKKEIEITDGDLGTKMLAAKERLQLDEPGD